MAATVQHRPWKGKKPHFVAIHMNGKTESGGYYATKKEANAIAKGINGQIVQKKFQLPTKATSANTVTGVWTAMLLEPSHRAGASIAQYISTMKCHIADAFGDEPVADLRRDAVKAYIVARAKAGYALKTIKFHVSTLSIVLDEAVEKKLVPANVCKGLQWKKLKKLIANTPVDKQNDKAVRRAANRATKSKRAKALTPAQVTEALTLAKKLSLEWLAFWVVLARTGMRIGELLALLWEDVDFARGVIVVRRTVTKDAECKSIIKDETKTEGADGVGERDVDMSKDCALVLQAWMGSTNARGLVFFPDRENRASVYQSALAVWREVTGAMPLLTFATTPHILRHSFASQLLGSGTSSRLSYVSKQLGHADIETTLRIYSHFIPTEGEKLVNTLDDAKLKLANLLGGVEKGGVKTHPGRILRMVKSA